MSQLPERVQIGPYRYAVRADAEALKDYEHSNRSSVWGCIRWKEGEILLDPEAQAQKHRETLLHEVIHGCNYVAGTAGMGKEERFTTALAPTLLDTLRRNPELVAFLLAEEEI
jgi:hypothetical protein